MTAELIHVKQLPCSDRQRLDGQREREVVTVPLEVLRPPGVGYFALDYNPIASAAILNGVSDILSDMVIQE